MDRHPSRWLAPLLACLLAIAVAAPAAPGRASQDVVAPVIFSAAGDQISGWWWLRDPLGTQRADWRAFGAPVSDVTLDLEVLATDAMGGGPGVDARFYLTVGALVDGRLGDPVLGPKLTQLENVSPPDDPVGYTNRGTVVIPIGSLSADAGGVWVSIERVAPDGTVVSEHVAVRSDSVRVHGLAMAEPALVTGTGQCFSGAPTETSLNGVVWGQVPEFTCTTQMSDPRVSGSAKGSLDDACFPASGCLYWGTFEIAGPGGTWTGSWSGTDDKDLGKASYLMTLQGTGAYQGWTFIVHWLDPGDGSAATASGLIYQGPPPPWGPLPTVMPGTSPLPGI